MNKKAAFGLFVVLCVAFWNLLDFIWSVFIVNGSYHFSGGIDLGVPVISAIIIGYLLFLRN